ncbi:Hcp family type VI secretion system effector [Pandoraea sp. NPDC087047]|uniref:Hcp family type VI secretion system effector n=1 Tax=Pandoraea sp. NPDC087047 TaxID=3364390 RepID=UPI0038124A79
MGIPAHLWLKDGGGTAIKGSSTVSGRDGSIEVISFSHGLRLPIDSQNGKSTGTRQHAPMMLEKEFDASSPYLYKAVATGQTLQSAELHWYRIAHSGKEKLYFVMSLEGVRVSSINPSMTNIKMTDSLSLSPAESVSLMYERITWRYVDGNIEYSDSWETR